MVLFGKLSPEAHRTEKLISLSPGGRRAIPTVATLAAARFRVNANEKVYVLADTRP